LLLFKELLRHVPGGTQDNYKKPHCKYSVTYFTAQLLVFRNIEGEKHDRPTHA